MGIYNSSNDWFTPGLTGRRDPFQEHDRRMKTFRLAHPKNWKQWGQRVPVVEENPLTLPSVALTRKVMLDRYLTN